MKWRQTSKKVLALVENAPQKEKVKILSDAAHPDYIGKDTRLDNKGESFSPSTSTLSPQCAEKRLTPIGRTRCYNFSNHATKEYYKIEDIEILDCYNTIAIDTETTGLERDAKLLGISFCGEAGKAFFMPADKIQPFVMEAILAGKQLIMHNAKFDLQVLARNGISLYGNPIFDTMIAHQLLDENSSHGLKHLAKTILGAEVTIEQNPIIESPLLSIDDSQLVKYACADADYTFQLYQRFSPQLKQENLSRLFTTVEMPLVKIVAKMEDWGILMDTQKIFALQTQLQEESKAILNEIFSLASGPFDLNSPSQLSALLYDKLNLESVKKTPSGKNSTDIESLEAIKDAHPIVEKILRFREIDKLLSTYLEKLPTLVDKTTGRIHCQLHQNGTVTGRFSCSEPNLQNIPRGDIIRSAFIPAPDHIFIDADFSQIELRCIAHYTQDENMLAAYHNGADLHKKTIADMLGKSIDDVTEKERFIAKSINFGLAYGMGATALSKRLGVDKDYAQSLMDKYFGVYSKVKQYIHLNLMEVQKRGYVVNMFGRRRRMINSDYHKAFNALIQSTATDICKIQMVRLVEALPETVNMVLQVHDELLFEVKREEAKADLEQIVAIMETPVTGLDGKEFSVPIKVEAKIAENWADAK
jgi:DNA polymerase-1